MTLCRDAEINRKIELTQSTRIASPIALWRREIVVPERAVTELPPAAMRSVLAHELAHLERRDPFWLAFAAVIEALCFFQPLNRLARRGMQESAELLCDDWAIARTGDGVTFAKSLAEVASWEQANRSSLLLAGMISGERPLVRRVRRALDGDPKRFEAEDSPRPTRMLVGVGSLAALIMVAPGAVSASPPSEAPSKRELRQQRKAERQADEARRKADEARAAAEAAEREAQRLAEEAGRAAAPAPEAPAANGSHLIIRDGDEYLIIDENGVRLRSKDADIDIIDGANPKMRMRVREGDQELDLDLDFDAITNMALEMLGEELLGGPMAPMPPPGAPMPPSGAPMPPSMPGGIPGMMFGPGFDLDEFEAMTEALEQLENIGFDEEALEREIEAIERELQEELMRELGRSFGDLDAHTPPPAPAPTAPSSPTPPAPPTLI